MFYLAQWSVTGTWLFSQLSRAQTKAIALPSVQLWLRFWSIFLDFNNLTYQVLWKPNTSKSSSSVRIADFPHLLGCSPSICWRPRGTKSFHWISSISLHMWESEFLLNFLSSNLWWQETSHFANLYTVFNKKEYFLTKQCKYFFSFMTYI